MSRATRALASWPALLGLLLVALLPVYGPFMAYIEGAYLPVTSRATILSVKTDGNGIDITYSYTKLRACELSGFQAKVNGVDAIITQIGDGIGQTFGIGPVPSRQLRLIAPSLDGVEMWVLERCSPLWLTATKIYG